MEHRPECTKAQEQYATDVAAYEAQWPNYCRTCRGWGVTRYYDDPIGEQWSSSHWFSEPCDDCAGRCPRCGADWPETDEEMERPCPACSWKYDKTPGLDEQPECDCWIEEWREADRRQAEELHITF